MAKNSKIGRNKIKCAQYRSENRRIKNKAKKLAKIAKRLLKKKSI